MKRGFTLIELLVVVLIIGILAAVAVPQYQKTVERSRTVEALTLLKTVGQSVQAYYMANGEWPTSFDELSTDIPWTGTTKFVKTCADSRSNGQWSLCITNSTNYNTLLIGRIDGKYKGIYLALGFRNNTENNPTPLIRCVERISDANFLFDTSLLPGAFCEKIIKGKLENQHSWGREYALP